MITLYTSDKISPNVTLTRQFQSACYLILHNEALNIMSQNWKLSFDNFCDSTNQEKLLYEVDMKWYKKITEHVLYIFMT